MVGAAIAASMLALALATGSPEPVVMSDAVTFHVRTTDSRVEEWIRAGATWSETFRSLLGRLSESDLIVYVQLVDRIPGAAGQTYFVKATDTVRYVRIEIVPAGNLSEMVALIGHELQHAVEIADAPRVRDRQALARFYLSMTENANTAGQYDSRAARVTEDRVRREVAGSGAVAAHTLARLKVQRGSDVR